jgi:hypothetical protein
MATVRPERDHGMSLLMFATDPSQVAIVTDTLATHPTAEPLLLLSKCSIVPHLEMAVAYTGVAQVGQRWAHQLQTAVLARNIDLLDQHVPGALRQVTAEVVAGFGELPGTSTVYHFGYSEEKEALGSLVEHQAPALILRVGTTRRGRGRVLGGTGGHLREGGVTGAREAQARSREAPEALLGAEGPLRPNGTTRGARYPNVRLVPAMIAKSVAHAHALLL